MTSLAQASAALLILSITLNLLIIIGAIIAVIILISIRRVKLSLIGFAVADTVDVALVLGPAIMWTYMLMNVTNDNDNGNSAAVEPGFGMLWPSFVAKICADESLLHLCDKFDMLPEKRPRSPTSRVLLRGSGMLYCKRD
jgi:hypothetical protein